VIIPLPEKIAHPGSLAPGKTIEHVERWSLLKGVPNETRDAAIDANIRPRVEASIK